MLEQSDPAPGFSLPSSDGTTFALSAMQGRKLVLYFYPRDNTAGCSKQAIGFSEARAAFADAGAEIYGISKDDMASHERFIAKKDLAIPLLSDANSDVCERYGVWKEKKMYGKTFMGIERSTFLIDEAGTIARIWRRVKVAGHVEEVLEAVRAL
ncbi:peroxiredoxin [Shimia sp.]|uniref:peroxiredoxin n=1 Tax=Shimia sp. TaxID=1954381 RepID=UPI003561CBFC